jgi:hypothetical protein
MTSTKKRLIAATVGSLLSVGALSGMASAQTTTTGGTSTTASTRQAEHEARRAAELDALAARLGVTRTALETALSDQRKADEIARIDAALAAGRITAEQATTLKNAVNQGLGGGRGLGGRGLGGRGLGGRGLGGPTDDSAATQTPAQRQAARKAADDARDAAIAKRLGVTVEKWRSAQKDQAKANVDQRVADGTLTAAQAAVVKQAIDLDIPGFGGGRGGHGGPGGGRGR